MSSQPNPRHTPQVFCRECGSPLVQTADWLREDASHWRVRLWCPECTFERTAVLDPPQVTYLSLAIEEGFASLLDALDELRSASLADETADLVKKALSERIESAGD